jgi:hypothetical protein
MKITMTIPIRLISEANTKDHWTKKRTRRLAQQQAVRLYSNIQPDIDSMELPIIITLIRLAPRKFDEDNLIHAFKSVRDQIADILIPNNRMGRSDSSPLLHWEYKQEKSADYGIKIILEEYFDTRL